MSSTESEPNGSDGRVTVDVEITDDRTVVTVSGDRDAAVVVRSASGEQIYLPPEDFDRPAGEQRQTPYDSPYQSASPYDSPYDSPYQSDRGGAPAAGVQPTVDGFRVVHPEPVTDFRLLR
ncbi:DUF7510 family protein [Candidatus Halobonum tyrrellensis]|uniref:Uncharacterized protein n=1 Tax=Candidatus Halobonum tyrrellensis G22 TaxID=1324957 RepID=V4HDH2_9EURY|nr:hypothetical protein [Candidatus Halobonum tyrrellensis]ESP88123.1 hypothetical protein K933_10547 [Candidatus Halobonum tyrrellensis G22]